MGSRLPPALASALESVGEDCREAFRGLTSMGFLDGVVGGYMASAGEQAWKEFLNGIRSIDIGLLTAHRDAMTSAGRASLTLSDIRPVRLSDCRGVIDGDSVAGIEAVSRGTIAAVVFAGGTATRFFAQMGSLPRVFPVTPESMITDPPSEDAPKGVYPVTAVMGRSFIHRLAEEMLCSARASGRIPILLFMTSDITSEPVRRHLDQVASRTGVPRGMMQAGPRQGMLPRLDETGSLIADPETGAVLLTGDGHGGVFRALASVQPGILEDLDGTTAADRLRSAGVRHLVMGNVDNALLRPFEPGRIGAHMRSGALFTTTLVKRRGASEKVGVPVVRNSDGRVMMVEYSELSEELGSAASPGGGLLLDCAQINTNIVSMEAVDLEFPYTLYRGKHVETSVGRISSSSFEKLSQNIVGAVPPQRVLTLRVPREEYFLPTKNMVGEDSLEETVRELELRDAGLLASAGAVLAGSGPSRTSRIEISPLVAGTSADLEALGAGPGWRIGEACSVYLGAAAGAVEGLTPYGSGLVMEDGSSLVISTDSPLGAVSCSPGGGDMRVDGSAAGMIRIGSNVTVRRGVRIRVHLRPGGRFVLPDGAVVESDMIHPGDL